MTESKLALRKEGKGIYFFGEFRIERLGKGTWKVTHPSNKDGYDLFVRRADCVNFCRTGGASLAGLSK